MHFQAMTEGISEWITVLDHRLVLTQQHSTLEPSESTGETAPKRNKKLLHGFIVMRSYYNYYYLLVFF
jgi:hypothetical protein